MEEPAEVLELIGQEFVSVTLQPQACRLICADGRAFWFRVELWGSGEDDVTLGFFEEVDVEDVD